MAAHCGTSSESNAGEGPCSTRRSHCTCTAAVTAGASGDRTAPSTESPAPGTMSPNPAAASFRCTSPRAAIPTSAHGPHCILTPSRPDTRQKAPSPSSEALAAA
eukprot:7076362-Prymnesium_polylepis.1